MSSSGHGFTRELVVLVADKDMEEAIKGLLGRPQALGIRPVQYDIFVYPRRDPGIVNEAQDFLRSFTQSHEHALVLFDHEGCGRDETAPSVLENQIEEALARTGWADRSRVIVLVPELEAWVWSQSPHVPRCLGWAGQQPPLRQWLAETGRWPPDAPKPPRPKEAYLDALRYARKAQSSAIYGELARSVSLQGHSDAAFLRFTTTVRAWFPSGLPHDELTA
jgi:hypothetical protein